MAIVLKREAKRAAHHRTRIACLAYSFIKEYRIFKVGYIEAVFVLRVNHYKGICLFGSATLIGYRYSVFGRCFGANLLTQLSIPNIR